MSRAGRSRLSGRLVAVPEPPERAAASSSAQTGIKTELSWDKVGVGLIEAMFEHMIHSFTDDDPPFDLICTDEILLRRFAAEGRVLALNDLMSPRRRHARRRDGGNAPRGDARRRGDRPALLQRHQPAPLSPRPAGSLFASRPAKLGRAEDVGQKLQAAVRRDGTAEFYAFATRGAGGGGHAVWSIGTFLGSFGARWLTDEVVAEPIGDAHRAALSTYLDLIHSDLPARPGNDQLRRAHARLPQRPRRHDHGGRQRIRAPSPRRSRIRRALRRGARSRRTRRAPAQSLQPAMGDPGQVQGSRRGLAARKVPVLAAPAARGRARSRTRSRPRPCPFSTAPNSTGTSDPIFSPPFGRAAPSLLKSGRLESSASKPASSLATR